MTVPTALQAPSPEPSESWAFSQGDPITAELTAMRLLGGGSSYEAYLAFDDVTYGPVVVKVLRPSQVADRTSLRGLVREVEALAAITHPVVVRALRHELDGDRPHLVLEQIDGPRLSTLVRRYGPLPEHQYLPLGLQLAGALHYLRRVGWTHLDVKPSNVIMGSPARLIDLSVARRIDRARELGYPIGTDDYMAPEQCDPPATGRPGFESDVWGVCATLFHAICGYRPFRSGDPVSDDVTARFPQLVDEPEELPRSVPAEVVEIVRAGLAKDPEKRPLPHELAEALEPVLARQPRAVLSGFRVR